MEFKFTPFPIFAVDDPFHTRYKEIFAVRVYYYTAKIVVSSNNCEVGTSYFLPSVSVHQLALLLEQKRHETRFEVSPAPWGCVPKK